MAAPLNQIQQERIYNAVQRTWYRIIQTQMGEATHREQISDSRVILQQRVNETNLQGLHLQEAMIEYLVLRIHEDALHLPQTNVPVILLPHFQNINYPDLQAMVNRLAVFPADAVSINPPQPAEATSLNLTSVRTASDAKIEALYDFYDAVKYGRITYPATIREIAKHFSEIQNDPLTSKKLPIDAGEAARNLLERAKLYEGQASTGGIYDANAQADMPARRRSKTI